MNKRVLKEFAVYARNEMRNQVALRAQAFGVTPQGADKLRKGNDYVEINGNRYPLSYQRPLETLIDEYNRKGYDKLIEEVAYTWFNRIIALRFMELHNYLPSRLRVLSSETEGKVDPDILTEYRYADLPVDEQEIAKLLQQGKREEAYRHLLMAQCNQLSEIMPFLFEKPNDFTDLLLPEHLLHADSLINKLVQDEELTGCFEEVEVIGWLYQYYIAEKKEQVGGLRNNAVRKEDLPFVTQLFTPKWIVQYMVQNSLGKMYHDLNPNTKLVSEWEYYLHANSNEENKHVPEGATLETIKFLDPACGSGHILVYAFELLYDMYEESGYPKREIPKLILSNNLYGLDIDKRAVQLASFALIMKAQEKYGRFLRKTSEVELNVHEFIDAQKVSNEALEYVCKNDEEKQEIKIIIDEFKNAKQFGSLILPSQIEFDVYIGRIEKLMLAKYGVGEQAYVKELYHVLFPILKQAKCLSLKYDLVITNPPYHNKYNTDLKDFVQKFYKNYKTDLYSAFIYRCTQMTVRNGYAGLMTPFTWMFISRHEKLREFIIRNQNISSLIQLEYSAFSEATVPICTFLIHNQVYSHIGEFIRLTDFKGEEQQPLRVKEAVANEKVTYRYKFNSRNFKAIPGNPIAYWASSQVSKIFLQGTPMGNLSEIKQGMATCDNDRFLRIWHEVEFNKCKFGASSSIEAKNCGKKWFPYHKGGKFRKWYGNHEFVVNWQNDGKEIKAFTSEINKLRPGGRVKNQEYYFRAGLTWSALTSSKISFRSFDVGFLFDTKGSVCFPKDETTRIKLIGLLNSKVADYLLKILAPTLDYNPLSLRRIPVLSCNFMSKIKNLIDSLINISKNDWDSYETSWDFKDHPLLIHKGEAYYLSEAFYNWAEFASKQFRQAKRDEEKLNEVFIDLYGLQQELAPEVSDEEITIRKADRERDAKSFLSYAIGCMMGRYSLDIEGLTYAGGEWDASKYRTFIPDKDAIIPLTDAAYFEDDVMTRLQEFLKVTFGEGTLQENLHWLAESLEMKNNETPIERLRRYFFDEFYRDHVRIYQKRPIYWLVDSGKNKGFRALIYLHRYTPDTLATLRFQYLHELQGKYAQEISRLEGVLTNPDLSATEKKKIEKQLASLRKRQQELVEFDKVVADYANQRIDLDLDDGVVVNYKKLQPILGKI